MFILPGLILVSALILGNGWLAGQFGTGEEILPAWNGSRAFLFEHADPYSKTIMERTQIEVYGRAARGEEYPYALDIPFSLLILFFPLSLIPDPVWARAVWMSLSEVGLIALVLLALQLTDWKPKGWFRILLILFSLGSFYSIVALLDSSLSILLTLAVVGALALLRTQNDEAAGMLLAIASFKWEVTLLLFIFVVIGAYLSHRWHVFIGYIMVWVVLGGVSYLLYPTWGWPYLRSITANLRADDAHTLAKYLSAWNPASGSNIALLLISILLLILVLEWFAALRSNDFRRVTWAAALSLAITPLAGYSTTFANLAPLVFSFVVILPFAWERWAKRPYLVLFLLCFIFFSSPYLILRQITDELLAGALLYLLPPVLTILGLYWTRWYVVRPPRTWIESARREIRK
ncbi:MAG: hypothetical protein HFACDABA_01057 [Anaerolineales bacterium]|nr:hypothetical protein [Anaerolineales bacterium]